MHAAAACCSTQPVRTQLHKRAWCNTRAGHAHSAQSPQARHTLRHRPTPSSLAPPCPPGTPDKRALLCHRRLCRRDRCRIRRRRARCCRCRCGVHALAALHATARPDLSTAAQQQAAHMAAQRAVMLARQSNVLRRSAWCQAPSRHPPLPAGPSPPPRPPFGGVQHNSRLRPSALAAQSQAWATAELAGSAQPALPAWRRAAPPPTLVPSS